MVEIRPFRGIRYAPRVAGDLDLNVCPPFDVIGSALQKELYERSPYNIVRLELARREMTEDPYYSAADTQKNWLDSGALRRDRKPSLYITQETFEFGGQQLVRRGFVAAVRLEEYDQEAVLPHEYTRSEWVNDRVRLMGVARANYSPLLVVFRDDMRSSIGGMVRAIAGGRPSVNISPPDLPALKMWRVSDPGTLSVMADAFKDSRLFIADGHHRYEAALRYRSLVRSGREVGRDESLNYRMMLLVSVDEPGLITRGYHRTIESPTPDELTKIKRNVSRHCELEAWTPPEGGSNAVARAFAAVLGERQGDEVLFGVMGLGPGSYHIARLKDGNGGKNALENSEYSRLHSLIIEPAFSTDRRDVSLNFQHDLAGVVESMKSGEASLGFAMRPIPMDEFIDIVTHGWRLPPKATNFFPKPSAGMVIQTLEGSL